MLESLAVTAKEDFNTVIRSLATRSGPALGSEGWKLLMVVCRGRSQRVGFFLGESILRRLSPDRSQPVLALRAVR